MLLYGINNNIIDTKNYSFFKSGGCSKLYRSNDESTLLKIYNIDCLYKYYLGKKIFNILKSKDIPNIVKLFDYYYEYNDFLSKKLPMDAYTMENVTDKKVELLNSSVEYLLDVCRKLDETLKELTNSRICIFDESSDNILFTENGVTVLDPDQFFVNLFFTKKAIFMHNKQKMLGYINKTIFNELKEKNINGTCKFDFIKKSTTLETDIIKQINKDSKGSSLVLTCFSK